MSEKPDHWAATLLQPSFHWIRFCLVLIPAVLLAGLECRTVQNQGLINASETASIEEIESANQEEESRLLRVMARVRDLEQEADSVLCGLLGEDMETPDLKALEGLGVQDAGTLQGEEVVRVRLSGRDLEYHKFVPLLNQQEVNTPLMRCLWLSLKAPGKPFGTAALPLQVDLELAFPRAISRASHSGDPLAK